MKTRKKRWGWLLILLSAVLLVSGYVTYQDYQILHHPEHTFSSTVVALEKELDLTDQGKRIFYATNPQIEQAEVFYRSAPKRTEQLLVWGYYLSGVDEIHVLANQKPELAGIEEVTTAHELLHAAWERLSAEERQNVGAELRMVYEKLKTESFENLMTLYEKEEPGQFENELHSILGTEYGELSSKLEEHYAKYFKNRSKLVSLKQQYGATFEAMEQQIKQLQADIEKLKEKIDAAQVTYEAHREALDTAIAQFNNRAASGSFTSQADFQAERSNLLAEQAAVDTESDTLNQWIEEYNTKVQELNTSAQQHQEFYQSIREPEKMVPAR
ncbi:hypothetical protein AB1I63_05650 [Streptococcus pneumoniae]